MHDRLSSLDWLQTHAFEVNIWRYISVLEKKTAYLQEKRENEAKAEMLKSQLKNWIWLLKCKILVPTDILKHEDWNLHIQVRIIIPPIIAKRNFKMSHCWDTLFWAPEKRCEFLPKPKVATSRKRFSNNITRRALICALSYRIVGPFIVRAYARSLSEKGRRAIIYKGILNFYFCRVNVALPTKVLTCNPM